VIALLREHFDQAGLLACVYATLVISNNTERPLVYALPVVVPAKGVGALPARLVEALSPILAALSIPPASVQAECERMREHRIGRTASRRVLGSLNELMFLLEHSLHHHPEWSHLEHSLRLAQTPCKLVEHSAPDRATQALFMSSAAVAKARTQASS